MFPGTSKAQSIHINPVFKDEVLQKIIKNCEEPIQAAPMSNSAHINPRFIHASNAKAKTIYMNPEFLNENFKQKNKDIVEHAKQQAKEPQIPKVTQLNKIISKSRTRIIREHAQQQRPFQGGPSKPASPILLLTKRKLVRATTATLPTGKKEAVNRVLRYKLDNKLYKLKPTAGAIAKRRPASSFVARYALRRCGGSIKHGSVKTQQSISLNRRLRLININGILYRSSQNKLQRNVEPSTQPTQNNAGKSVAKNTKIAATNRQKGRTVYVRGKKFVLDPQGFKLTRVTTTANVIASASPFSTAKSASKAARCASARVCQPRRIDIGGHTYVASSSNVFVRTSTHLVLAHLNQAKQRSVSVLSRCLRKVNKPCIIFQRLGKCAAFERNRCSKIHDKQQVIVCPQFLQGACTNPNCLLSHNKTYQKMPVCKFFLQGCCVRNDCHYLHKKLSEGSDICEDFRRGFCMLGEKCNKQHIFPEAKAKSFPNAAHFVPQPQERLLLAHSPGDSHSPVEENVMTSRYFSDETFILGLSKVNVSKDVDYARTEAKNEEFVNNFNSSYSQNEEHSEDENDDIDSNVETSPKKRKPLGRLPAFIPLS